MEFIQSIARLWNEFLMVAIGSGIVGVILAGVCTVLAERLKLISSIVVAIPMAIALYVTKVTGYIALFLGIIQLALKLL